MPTVPTAEWPLPRRVRDHLVLDSPRGTLLYWGAVALVVAGLFVTRLLPCVDYPQHLALSDIARRLADPAAPENAQYQLNYFTYNGLFHVAVAWIARVLPIELAGRLVVALSLAGMAGAVLALVRVVRRPPAYAALFTPILFSFSVGWGFVNYVLATTIAAWALVFVARAAVRPTALALVAVGVLGLACAFAHVLAMLILCLAATGLSLELAWRTTAPSAPLPSRLVRTLMRATVAAVPLVIGCIYCIEVYRRQYVWDPNMYRDPVLEGSAPPLWEKLTWFGAFATDLFWDATDQVILWASIAVMVCSEWLAWKRRRGGDLSREDPPPLLLPFLLLALAYFATPMVLVGTHLIFPRLAQWAVLGAVLATPRFPAATAGRAQRWILGIALAAGADVLLHCGLYAWETNDASRVIDDLPPGRSATAVIWEPGTFAFRNGTLTHLAAYYAARKHGEWAFAFARYLSVPVRFRPGAQPAWPAHGWEFQGEAYDPRCRYARAFPLVIVKAPKHLPRDESGEPLVRALVFKQDAQTVRLLSHHGRYWAFDSAGLPDDGTL
ncbi:MAG TPA: hypothetical protein VHS09_14755 [Polyangiaceae bacterium]|nr:hypothetical protein [Polyangiaceae bacterium]